MLHHEPRPKLKTVYTGHHNAKIAYYCLEAH